MSCAEARVGIESVDLSRIRRRLTPPKKKQKIENKVDLRVNLRIMPRAQLMDS